MFLRANFLGVSPFIGKTISVPPLTTYDVFKFYGGSNGSIFSKIWGVNKFVSGAEINGYTLETYTPTWTNDTYFLSKFNNTLNAGSVEGLTREIEEWLIYRKESTSDVLVYLDTINVNTLQFYDFTALNTKEYQYYIFANDGNALSNQILSNNIISDYYGWFLIDVENSRSYHFDVNFEGGDNSFIETVTEHKTNNRVNSYTKSKHFYLEGSITSIISHDNLKQDLQYTNDDLLSLASFIVSDRPKLLKTRRGELYNVFTYGYSEVLLNPALSENIYVSTFNFKEVGDE